MTMRDIDKRKRAIKIIISLVVLFLCAGGLYHYRYKFDLSKSLLTRKNRTENSKNVMVKVTTHVGSKILLDIEMAIPCEDGKQRADLTRNLKTIKSDLLTSIDHTDMEGWIRERKFGAIKSQLLEIVNRHVDKPVKHLYFQSFLYF
jgi:flagellar basal body-associated protein FliL